MLTVVMATHNGARTLPRVLDAYRQLVEPPGGWRGVIVDNASTDDTRRIVQDCARVLPVTYLYEPEAGQNRARNRAIPDIGADIIAFSDDDTIPAPDWLVQLAWAAEDHPEYSVFGGHILPAWDTEPADWILRKAPLGLTYAITDPTLESGPITPGLVWSGNMAMRREVFDAGHRFSEQFGPGKRSYVMGSETEFNLRMAQAGYRFWFCTAARVSHIIRPEQLSEDWIVARAFRFGRSVYHQRGDELRRLHPQLLGTPRWMFRKLAEESLRMVGAKLSRNSDQAFEARWEASYLRGYIAEAMRWRKQVRNDLSA